MRAKEFMESTGSDLMGSLQLFVPRPDQVNEVLKPTSGFMYSVLWTSTARKERNGYTSDWVEWCRYEMPQWLSDKGILYKVKPSARILTMNTDEDAFSIAEHYGLARPVNRIASFTWAEKFPWDDIERDYDAIHHVPSGNRFANILMSSWDVESTAWFNAKHLEKLGEVKVSLDESE